MDTCLLDRWVQESNAIVNKFQQDSGHPVDGDQDQSRLKWCSSEFRKLLTRIQGVCVTGLPQLELTVLYNACLLSICQNQVSEAQELLTHGLGRALEAVGCDPGTSDPSLFWRAALRTLGTSECRLYIQQLFCLQWAIWLSVCSLETIQDWQEELSSLSEGVGPGVESEWKTVATASHRQKSLVVLDCAELRSLLQICTVIVQGAEWLKEGRASEALAVLQRGLSLPAPRPLLANTYLLSGLCLHRTGRPQMALQYYRKAIETDSRSVGAVHQSTLIYRDLGNTQAEIQALRLLNSALKLPPATESTSVGPSVLCPSILLRCSSLGSLLSVPPPLCVLHSLALKCVLHGRVSEGVEHYLDLLTALQSDDQHTMHPGAPPLPRLPQLYLETGSALLMAQRPADCMVLCDEIISLTLELLPGKLTVEEVAKFDTDFQTETGPGSQNGLHLEREKLDMFLWTGSAYLLQANCQAHLKDWKQAVTHYTRCINLLLKVSVKKEGFLSQTACVDMTSWPQSGLSALQRLKGLSLAGRGIGFAQRDQLREALRDLQLSLQTSPGCVHAGLWLGEVLWRLERKHEAAACWGKTWASGTEPFTEALPRYLQDLQCQPSLDPTVLKRRIEEIHS